MCSDNTKQGRPCGINLHRVTHHKHIKSDKHLLIIHEKKTKSELCKLLKSTTDYRNHSNCEKHSKTYQKQQMKIKINCNLFDSSTSRKDWQKHEFSTRR